MGIFINDIDIINQAFAQDGRQNIVEEAVDNSDINVVELEGIDNPYKQGKEGKKRYNKW